MVRSMPKTAPKNWSFQHIFGYHFGRIGTTNNPDTGSMQLSASLVPGNGWWKRRSFPCGMTWVFPKIGVPPNHPGPNRFNRVFHYKPSILGYPYFRKHPPIFRDDLLVLGRDWKETVKKLRIRQHLELISKGTSLLRNLASHTPYHPCMVYLPTFTIKFNQT